MCLQCITAAEYVNQDCHEILPGWVLMRSTNDHAPDDWPAGSLGLIECNDPTFVFNGEIVPDPCPGGTDEEYESVDDSLFDSHVASLNMVLKSLNADPMSCWRLVEAARQVGFRPEKAYSPEFALWLMDRMAAHGVYAR